MTRNEIDLNDQLLNLCYDLHRGFDCQENWIVKESEDTNREWGQIDNIKPENAKTLNEVTSFEATYDIQGFVKINIQRKK